MKNFGVSLERGEGIIDHVMSLAEEQETDPCLLAARSTAGERIDALGSHPCSDADGASGKLVQAADEAVRPLLEHGTGARPTTAIREPSVNGTVLPGLAHATGTRATSPRL